MEELIRQNSGLLASVAMVAYGAYKLWQNKDFLWSGLKSAMGFAKPSTRAEAFAALELLRVHFKDNKEGLAAIEMAGAAFWKEPPGE